MLRYYFTFKQDLDEIISPVLNKTCSRDGTSFLNSLLIILVWREIEISHELFSGASEWHRLNFSSLYFLLHADDLILISRSADLIGYKMRCPCFPNFAAIGEWTSTPKKQKPLHFKRNIQNRTFKSTIFLLTEETNGYTYLGIRFSTNGSFKENKMIFKRENKKIVLCNLLPPWFSKIASWYYQQDI